MTASYTYHRQNPWKRTVLGANVCFRWHNWLTAEVPQQRYLVTIVTVEVCHSRNERYCSASSIAARGRISTKLEERNRFVFSWHNLRNLYLHKGRAMNGWRLQKFKNFVNTSAGRKWVTLRWKTTFWKAWEYPQAGSIEWNYQWDGNERFRGRLRNRLDFLHRQHVTTAYSKHE